MTTSLVVTVVGPDRPGIVNQLSDAAQRLGANWEASRMANLAGQFAGMVHFEVPDDRADALAKAAHRLAELPAAGIINLTGDERVSKYAFALRLASAFGLPGELIQHDKISHSGLHAKRPSDMSLDNTRARDLLGTGLGRLDDYFLTLRRQEEEGRREELIHAVTE